MRRLLQGEHGVGRVIARPLTEKRENSTVPGRKDYSLPPPSGTMLDLIKEAGQEVIAVGKITDIFAGQGITRSVKTKNNLDGIESTISVIGQLEKGLIFTNLVDFDMLYGHRNDVEGYAKALEEFDLYLPGIINEMKEKDLLIITADHGTDPTTGSTDHSREYVPLLIYGRSVAGGISLGTRTSFADLGATVVDYLQAGVLQAESA